MVKITLDVCVYRILYTDRHRRLGRPIQNTDSKTATVPPWISALAVLASKLLLIERLTVGQRGLI